MDVWKIPLIGMTGVFLAVFLRHTKAEYAQLLSLGVALLLFLACLGKLQVILDTIETLKGYLNLKDSYFQALMKMTGITYITEFAASICRDSGHQAVAVQIELFGKLSVFAVSLPLLSALLETVTGLLQ